MKETTVQPAVPGKETIVVNDIRITSADRSQKDILTWRNAHRSAESHGNPNRVNLYDLYADILLDGHLSGIVGKRINSVLGKTMYFQDASGKKVDDMDKLISSLHFRNLCTLILETVFWGISGVEFIPGKEFYFAPIPRKHIKPEFGVIALQQSSTTGIAFADEPNIWVIGGTNDLGILLQCAPYALYKRGSMADWANYIEVFGQPVRVIKYDGNDDQTKIELRKILDESGNSLSLLIPDQANFEMKDGKQSNGDGQLQERFKDAMNQEMSIIVVGNTETTTNGKTGTGAKSKVHQEQQELILQSDIYLLQSYLNSEHFLSILTSYGLPVTGGRFVIEKGIDIDALQQRIAVDKELATLVDIPADYFYDTYGIPKPEGNPKKPEPKKPEPKKPEPKNQSDELEDEPDHETGAKDAMPPNEEEWIIKTPSKSRWKNLKNAFKDFFVPAR